MAFLIIMVGMLLLTIGSIIVGIIHGYRNLVTKKVMSTSRIVVRGVALFPIAFYIVLYLVDPQYMRFFFYYGVGQVQPFGILLGVFTVMIIIINYVVMTTIVDNPRISTVSVIAPILVMLCPVLAVILLAPSIPVMLRAVR